MKSNKTTLKNIFFLSIFLIPVISQAQVGYMGKRNQLSIDVLDPFLMKQYTANYTLTVSRNIALTAGYSMINTEKDLKEPISIRNEGLSMSSSARSVINGNTFTGGILVSSFHTGMPLPLGYYTGLIYDYHSSDISDKYTDSGLEVKFKNHFHSGRIIYGKNTLLGANFTLDIRVEAGVRSGTLEAQNPSILAADGTILKPNLVFPIAHPFSNGKISDPYNGSGKINYFDFVLLPKVRIGYMF